MNVQSIFGWTRIAAAGAVLLGLLAVALLISSPALAQSPPAAVGSVTLTRADGTVTASWDAPAGATKYHVTYTNDGGQSWHAPVNGHTNITATSLTFNADNAKSYIVGVRAGNDNGQWSGWRNSPEAGPYTPPDANPPAAVGSITLNRSDATLTVSWNAVSDATKYHAVYQATAATGCLPSLTTRTSPPPVSRLKLTTARLTSSASAPATLTAGVRGPTPPPAGRTRRRLPRQLRHPHLRRNPLPRRHRNRSPRPLRRGWPPPAGSAA